MTFRFPNEQKNSDYILFNKSGILNRLKPPQTLLFLETLILRGQLFYKVFIQRSDTSDIGCIQPQPPKE